MGLGLAPIYTARAQMRYGSLFAAYQFLKGGERCCFLKPIWLRCALRF